MFRLAGEAAPVDTELTSFHSLPLHTHRTSSFSSTVVGQCDHSNYSGRSILTHLDQESSISLLPESSVLSEVEAV